MIQPGIPRGGPICILAAWAEIPATFRSWPDYEDRAATIRTWNPGILGGLVQTELRAERAR